MCHHSMAQTDTPNKSAYSGCTGLCPALTEETVWWPQRLGTTVPLQCLQHISREQCPQCLLPNHEFSNIPASSTSVNHHSFLNFHEINCSCLMYIHISKPALSLSLEVLPVPVSTPPSSRFQPWFTSRWMMGQWNRREVARLPKRTRGGMDDHVEFK